MSVHTCRPGHKGILADGCERCLEHAEHPFAGLDHVKLSQLAELAALGPDRFSKAETAADLYAVKHIVDAIDHIGRLMEIAPDVIVADLRKRWRVPIVLEAVA